MALPTTGLTGLAGGISTPSIPSVPSLPSTSAISSLKPSTVVKIDTQTGIGVPGGFSGSSLVQPSSVLSKLKSASSAISSAKAKVVSALNSGQQGVTSAALKKLNGLQSSVASKIKAAAQAPDFTKYQPILPKPIDVPAIPNFQSAGISIPSVPAAPSVPSLSSGVGSVPTSIPTTSGVSIPTPPSIPKIV